MHFGFQLFMFLKFQPSRLADRALTFLLIPCQVQWQLILPYVGTSGLCSHSQTHSELNRFPSVTLIHNSLALTVFVIRALPQKVKPWENLGLGTKDHSGKKNRHCLTRTYVKSQNGTIQFQYTFTFLKDWSKKQQSPILISSNKCLARQNSCAMYIFRLLFQL